MKHLLTKAALGAVVLACASAANAYVIDFESFTSAGAPFGALLADGNYVSQGGYNIYGQDGNNATNTPDGSLTAAIVNGSDASTCLSACAAGNTTHYIAGLNDGIVSVQSASGTAFTLSSFSAAFLPPGGVALPATQVAYLAVEGDRPDGSFTVALYSLLGPSASTGLTTFQNFSAASPTLYNGGTGTLLTGNFSALFFYAYFCSGSTCSGFTTDKAQFGLDNINVTAAVPEPSEWLLMALGLAGVGAVVRRRAAV